MWPFLLSLCGRFILFDVFTVGIFPSGHYYSGRFFHLWMFLPNTTFYLSHMTSRTVFRYLEIMVFYV